MKTTKKLIVLCLALVMALVAVMPSTFSWYNHNGTYSGNSFKLTYNSTSGEDSGEGRIPVSSGSVSMTTKLADIVDSKWVEGNTVSAFSNIAAGGNQHYITKLTNNGSTDLNLNLYINQLLNDDQIKVGVVNPVVNERNFADEPEIKKAEITSDNNNENIRVYFQERNVSGWNNNRVIYACYWTKSGSKQHTSEEYGGSNASYALKVTPNAQVDTSDNNTERKTMYIDLPADTSKFYFYSAKKADYVNSDDARATAWHRTGDINVSSLPTRTIYYLTGGVNSSTYNNAAYDTYRLDNLASVLKYYESVNLSPNSSVSMSLANSEYTGSGLSYYMTENDMQDGEKNNVKEFNNDSSQKVTLDENSGYVTLKNVPVNSTFKIFTKVKGELGDEYIVTTTVTVPQNITGVPIVQNVLIEKNGGEAEVRWYIKNDSASSVNCGGLFYSI